MRNRENIIKLRYRKEDFLGVFPIISRNVRKDDRSNLHNKIQFFHK